MLTSEGYDAAACNASRCLADALCASEGARKYMGSIACPVPLFALPRPDEACRPAPQVSFDDRGYAAVVHDAGVPWLTISTSEPFLRHRSGVGLLIIDHLDQLLDWSWRTKVPDTVVWDMSACAPQLHRTPTLSLRANGGVTIQMDPRAYPVHLRGVVAHAAISACGCHETRRAFSQSQRDAREACDALITGTSIYEEDDMEFPIEEQAKAHLAVTKCIELHLQRAVRRTVDVVVFYQAARHIRLAVASVRMNALVNKNLETIKKRLWHPQGTLFKRRLMDLMQE